LMYAVALLNSIDKGDAISHPTQIDLHSNA